MLKTLISMYDKLRKAGGTEEGAKKVILNKAKQVCDTDAEYNYLTSKLTEILNSERGKKYNTAEPKANLKKELAWVNKALPQTANRVRITQGFVKLLSDPSGLYVGKFLNGAIELSEKYATKGAAYHEAFHFVFNALMNNTEREYLLRNARKILGENTSVIDAEEWLADMFADYVGKKETGFWSTKIGKALNTIFSWLKDMIGIANTNQSKINEMFNSIYKGEFANREMQEVSVERGKSVLTLEEQLIKRNTIANGTFMLAPNGNNTNLTEKQWLQVRTKAFKEWFGDWEAVARQKFGLWGVFNQTSATYEGVSVTRQQFNPDMAPDGGSRDILIQNGNEYEVIGDIPTVETSDAIYMSGSIGAATEVYKNYRGKGFGKKAHIALAIIAAKDGKTLYSDSSNSDVEDALWKSLVKDGLAEVIEEKPKTGNWNHTTYRIKNSALPKGEVHGFGDNVSKVVDENGEPLVVYRGSENGIFNDPSNKDYMYFSSNRGDASIYSKGLLTKGGQLFSNYKDIKTSINSYISNLLGEQFNVYNLDAYTGNESIFKKYEELKNKNKEIEDLERLFWLIDSTTLRSESDLTKQYDDFDYIANAGDRDNLLEKYKSILDKYKTTSGKIDAVFLNIRNPYTEEINTEDLSNNRDAYKNGHDGAFLTGGDHFLVKGLSQIKSATNNSGAFSTEDNDIYDKPSLAEQKIQILKQEAIKVAQRNNEDISDMVDEMSEDSLETYLHCR